MKSLLLKPVACNVCVGLLLFFSIHSCTVPGPPDVSIISDPAEGEAIAYVIEKLGESLQNFGISYEVVDSINGARGRSLLVPGWIESPEVGQPDVPESYLIRKARIDRKDAWFIRGFDERGLIYGLLDLKERIERGKGFGNLLKDKDQVVEQPYVQYRSVSLYTMHRKYWESRFYDEAYWVAYLDKLMENKFNTLVVIFGYENGGFLAPCYPYFFNVEGFPEVRMKNISASEQTKNRQALERMVELAHERGLDLKIGIWDHIYRGGVQSGGIPGDELARRNDDHQVEWLDADNLNDYTKVALSKFIQTFPGIDGIQFRMHSESGIKKGQETEDFWTDVFGMIKTSSPGLQIDLRANINRENQFDRRHGYADMLRYPKEYGILWRMWTGGTQRILTWGNPEYVKRFAESTHLYDGVGFEINEPLATKMETQPHDAEPFDLLQGDYVYYNYEFERYWYFFQLFGRLTYNPNTSRESFDQEFINRFGIGAGPLIQEALHRASKVLPSQTSLWFSNLHHEIDSLVALAKSEFSGKGSREFQSTITDLGILSNLAIYHSRRIPAAVSYRIYKLTNDPFALDDAIEYGSSAIKAWEKIVEAAGEVYARDLMIGVPRSKYMDMPHSLSGHWKDELVLLEQGLHQLKNERKSLPFVKNTRSYPSCQTAASDNHSAFFEIQHHAADSARIDTDLKISLSARASKGIKWIKLRYRSVNQHLDYQTILMQKHSGTDRYEAVVPAGQIDPKFDFVSNLT